MFRLSRSTFAGLATALAFTWGGTTLAQSAASYEALTESTLTLDETLKAAKALARDCSCADAEKATCESERDAASKQLKKGQKVRFGFTSKAVSLGKYSRAKKQLAVRVEGGLLEDDEAPACPKDDDCAQATEARGLPTPATAIELVTTGEQIWRGNVTLEPEQAAQLQEIPSRVQGEAVFELVDASTRTLDRQNRADWKAAQVKALTKEGEELRAQLKKTDASSRDYVQQLLDTNAEQLACVKKEDAKGSLLTLKLKPVGVRLQVRDPRFPGYLHSEPPSTTAPSSEAAAK